MLKRANVSQAKKISRLFHMLGQPARLRILMAIGMGEACVCHLEAALGYRQAYISQHLMVLRKMKLVTSRREGRNIFYRLTDLETLHLLREAANLIRLPFEEMNIAEDGVSVSGCPCPNCESERTEFPLTKVNKKKITST